ncbi:hypothetical protein [Micromonospora sp. NPDC005979]|uniref:hypothetical protein n=1 Tax=Micromonospora sp. NPDC005979 TaxID=3156726 RepID=UPI0033A173AA
MQPRRRPRSWLAGRLRSVAGAVQRLAGRVDNPTAEPERPAEPSRRLGEPPQHWVDLVAAHAPGLLRELDVDVDQAAPTRDETPPSAAPSRRPDRSGEPASPPVAGRTDRPVAAALGDPHPRARPGGAGDHVRPGLEAGGPGHPDGGSERRLPIIRPAIPHGSTSSSGTARSDGSASADGRDSAASVGGPFRAPAVAHPGEAVATPRTTPHLPPAPVPPGESVQGLGTARSPFSRRSALDATTSRHGRGGGRAGGPSWPALPDEPAGPARLGEHPTDRHARPHAGHHPEQHSDRLPDQRAGRLGEHHREPVADHHLGGRSRQLPEHRASPLPDQRPTGRYGGPDQHHAPRHGERTRPDRDQRADNRYAGVRRGGEVGRWDARPGYGTGTAEVDGTGPWPVSAPFPSAAVGPGVDPWPALPDDGPLWTVPGTALDAGHERRLDREQAGG